MEASNFAFLRELHPELASLAEQAEGSIWSNPRGTLMQGRLFGEILATTISTQEKVEPVYSIKQIDRLHKLAREGLLTEEIRNKFEWLRMNGNAAAHSSSEVHSDLALTAHRNMFELSAWFVELYGSVDSEVPPYQMPIQQAHTNHQIEQPPVLDTGLVEKVISDQLEARLLPTLDEKFRSIEEALQRIAETRTAATAEVINSPEHSLRRSDNQVQSGGVTTSPPSSEGSDRIEIAVELNSKSLTVIDKRPFGGALWVVGGWELKEALGTWNDQGIYFRYAKNGSQSTKRKPAWFMLGKDPSAQRWVAISQPQPIEEVCVTQADIIIEKTVPQTEESVTNDRDTVSAEVRSPSVISTSPVGEETKENTTGNQTDVVVDKERDTSQVEMVRIPERLLEQSLQGFASDRLVAISESLGVIKFGDWSEERLLELYERQPKLLHDVMVQLWFFGFQFEGKLGRFVKLQHDASDEYIGRIDDESNLTEILASDVCRLLGRFGIFSSHQLSGLPVSSLAWLLRGRHADTVNSLRKLEKHSVQTAPPNSSVQVHKVFRLNGEQIGISEQICALRIDELNFNGCNALLKGIQQDWNIHYVKDLPEVLNILPTKIKGVGLTALSKFFEQLKQLDKNNDPYTLGEATVFNLQPIDRSTPVSVEGRFYWRSEETLVAEVEYQVTIDRSFFSSVNKLLSELIIAGIETIGQLPSHLEQLLEYPGVGATAVDKFHSQLVQMLFQHRLQEKEKTEWNLKSPEARIADSIEQIELNWQAWLQGDDKSRGSERNLEVLRYRWIASRDGRKATLEETGQNFSLTRERVRQILIKQNKKLQKDTKFLEAAIRTACEPLKGFFKYPLQPNESFIHYLIIETLEVSGLNYLGSHGWWTERTMEEIQNLQQSLHRLLRETCKGALISDGMLEEKLASIHTEFVLPNEFIYLLPNAILRRCDKGYLLANSSKADLVEMVLRNYPTGIEIYKKANELMEEANAIWPDSFCKDREITSIFNRDEFADTAYLWGRGTYIHYSFVEPDIELLKEIAAAAEKLLEVRSPISVGRLYSQFEEALNRSNVPNEYALYTLLRKHASSTLQLRKFPHIWHEKDSFQINNSEMIKSYIREMNRPVTREEIMQEFVERRGWKKFTIEYNLSSDTDYVRVDYGIVALREFYFLGRDDFNKLFNKLSTLLESRPIIHIKLLFEEMKEYSKSLDIQSDSLLYDLMQAYTDTETKFIRYPFVVRAGQEIEDVSMQNLTEQYILEQGLEVPREQVWQWLTDELGARQETLDGVLFNSKNIFYYTRGQYGEYIHRDNLGWDDAKEQQLMNTVSHKLQEAYIKGQPYILAEQILIADGLPTLENDVEWTEDLIIDVLKKGKKVGLIGSYDSIIISIEDSVIQRESDFVAYILDKEFDGQAPARDLHRRLAELRYSQDGQLLYNTLTDIENEVGRLRKDGDKYILI
ncbi:hypothetical protein M4D81_05640 [Paenibacillus sp. p3-SID867]|uniref:sigma factor-like helix-turn-helix DNA-binding protein n=1 Tax=Paenibacillus sp. p3-SID867 TaxID=2916363 RepID=UPI0021A39416|nr:sigma factor-like helix-turn-helix DNA-binding protein [Paenibacillus sp. p3-SID867]MCT1398486.1 hypothetical protein [Paenibacillus sp. p3-SID867]